MWIIYPVHSPPFFPVLSSWQVLDCFCWKEFLYIVKNCSVCESTNINHKWNTVSNILQYYYLYFFIKLYYISTEQTPILKTFSLLLLFYLPLHNISHSLLNNSQANINDFQHKWNKKMQYIITKKEKKILSVLETLLDIAPNLPCQLNVLCITVTLLGWIMHRSDCSKRPTKKASPASWSAIMAALWNLRSDLMLWATSLTTHWKGTLCISNSVLLWYFLISLRALDSSLQTLFHAFFPPSVPYFFLSSPSFILSVPSGHSPFLLSHIKPLSGWFLFYVPSL